MNKLDYGDNLNILRRFVCFAVLFGALSAVVSGQTNDEPVSQLTRLPPLSSPVQCGLALRYIDSALNTAYRNKSNLISIVKMSKPTRLALARSRSKNLRNYFRFRGFQNFEIAFNFDGDKEDRIELYVTGELLYSLPVKKKDKLFLGC